MPERSISGSISPRPIPIRRRCGSARWPREARRRRCASGRSCSARSSRRRAGTPRRSISTRPRAATCGATWSGSAPTSRCRSAGPSRFRRTACWRRASRWSGSTDELGRGILPCGLPRQFAEGRRIDDAATHRRASWRALKRRCRRRARRPRNPTRSRCGCAQQTEEAQRLGIFGAPSFVTADGELFWGNDRLERRCAGRSDG